MGSSIYWYRVDAESFKHFVKVEDKFDLWRLIDVRQLL